MDARLTKQGQISDSNLAEIRKNFQGLKFDNTRTETGFLYRWYREETVFYYCLKHPKWVGRSKPRRGHLNKVVFFEYWLKLRGHSDDEIVDIWKKLKISREQMDRRTLLRYKKNRDLNECYHELRFQREIEGKSWDDLRMELIDKPWEKKIGLRSKGFARAFRLHNKILRYLKENPRARFSELEWKFSIGRKQLDIVLEELREVHVAPGKKLTAEILCTKN